MTPITIEVIAPTFQSLEMACPRAIWFSIRWGLTGRNGDHAQRSILRIGKRPCAISRIASLRFLVCIVTGCVFRSLRPSLPWDSGSRSGTGFSNFRLLSLTGRKRMWALTAKSSEPSSMKESENGPQPSKMQKKTSARRLLKNAQIQGARNPQD